MQLNMISFSSRNQVPSAITNTGQPSAVSHHKYRATKCRQPSQIQGNQVPSAITNTGQPSAASHHKYRETKCRQPSQIHGNQVPSAITNTGQPSAISYQRRRATKFHQPPQVSSALLLKHIYASKIMFKQSWENRCLHKYLRVK